MSFQTASREIPPTPTPMQPRKEMWQSHRDWGTAGREPDCAPSRGMNRSTAPSLLTLSPQVRLHLSWSVLLSACLICRRSPLYTKACWGTFHVLNQPGTQVRCVGDTALHFLGILFHPLLHPLGASELTSKGVTAPCCMCNLLQLSLRCWSIQ